MADYDELAQADTRVNQIPTGVGGAPAANPYDDLATQEMEAGYAHMRQSLGIALKQDPDSVAKRKLLSDQTGIPLPVVERNDEIIQMQQRAREIQAAAQQSPILRRQLADPKFAALAHDSAENLSAVESAVRHLTGAPRALTAGLLTDFNAGAWGLAEAGARTLGAQDTGDFFRSMRKTQEAMGSRIQGDYGRAGLGEAGVASGFRSFGGMLPATVASVLTGNPSFMLATGGVTSGGQAAARGLDAGLNPAQALLYGAQDATAEVATEMIPVARLFKDLRAGTPFFQLLGRQLALEVPTEMAATAWQNFNEWANINPQKSFEDYLVELGPAQAQTVIATVTQTILSAGMASGAARLTRRYEREREQAAAAEQDAATLAQINALAAADKLRTRDPRSFEQFVAAATEDGPVQEVYLDARTLQQAGVDLQALAQASPAVAAQVAEAIATGGDIVIPVSEYAARVAGTDLDPLLTPHLRTAEDGLSLDEVQRFYQDQAGRMSQAAQQVMAEREQDVAWRESAKQVEDDLRAQLQNTGRFTNDVNNAYATLMRDFYVTTAQRLGITPLEMFQRYPIQVRAESVAAEQRMEQGGQPPPTQTTQIDDVTGLPLNSDGTVTVWHHTSAESAAQIQASGRLKAQAEPDVYVTTRKEADTGYGDTAVPIRVKPELLQLDDEFPDGRIDYRLSTGRPGGSIRVGVGEAQSPQPTSPLQRLAQSFLQAIGGQAPAQQPAQQPAVQARDAMDMGQFFQSEQPERDLIIQHSLTAENLLNVARTGGLAVPSLAVTRADNAITSFGDITLLGDAGTATPGGDTKVFGADIYSPRYPSIAYKLDAAALRELNTKLAPFTEGREIYGGEISKIGDLIGNKAFKLFAADKLGEKEPNAVRYSDLQGVASALFTEIGATERIFQGFTYSGKRRYIPHTLDNVVKILKKELRGGENFNYGVGSVRAQYTPQFRSLAAIRKEKGRLVSREDFEKIKKEIDEEFFQIGDTLRPFHPSSNSFGYADAVSLMMSDAAKMGLPRALQENGFEDVTPEAMGEVRDYLNKLRNLPTEYFEAKITRAVDLSEFAAAVVPSDIKPEARAVLEKARLPIYEYAKGDDAARRAAVKKAAGERGLFFQPQANQEGNRGEIAFARDVSAVPSVITLFKTADLSTFLHEMGHFQLEVLANIASRPDAPQALVDDFNAALKWFGITGNQNVRGGEQGGALGQSAVESGAFREWFGDSKVVDADGKPLVVYHGTDADFSVFDQSRARSASGAAPSDLGFWFVADADYAENHGSSVIPAYLSLQNPFTYSREKWGAISKSTDFSALRQRLEAEGYDGVVVRESSEKLGRFDVTSPALYVAFSPEQIKSAIGNRGTFDPNDPNILNQGGDDGVKGPLPSGRTPLEVWQAMSLEEKRPYHEQFARGFEAYLFEGKAPNAELDTLFARFRAWLINVYKSIKALNVELNDEIRGVFDRLVASQDAINQAEAVRSYAPLFTEPAANMGPAEWEQYQDLASEATQKAISDLQRRSLRDMQWLNNARGRVLKQLQRDAKDKRKAVEAEVRAEVQAMPVYAAMRFLKRGEMVTEEGEQIQAEKGHKLDTDALAEMYPETMLARPELDGLRGMTRKDGLHPDLVAEMFGFTSGDQLVREILDAEPEASVIEGMTDQRVLERYGDLANPDTIARAADEAIHNEARARFVATELKALTSAAGPVRAMTKAAKDFASALVARKKLRDIKPNQHASAEARAAKAAQKAMAEGDTAQAAVQKRNQLVQNYATRLSYEALDEVDKSVAYLRKFDREGVRKSIDTEYTDQIDQLLERFDLRASTPLVAGQKRASLLAWVETQRERGFEPDIPPELITEAQRKPYREMTLEEMRGLVDTVKQIEHLGRLKKKLLTAQDEREFQAIRDEIAASIEANAKGVRELRTRNNVGAMLKEAGNRFLAMHRKMASVAREMDGFQDGGPMWEYLIRSMNAAGNVETEMRAAATANLHAMLKPLLAEGPMGGKGQYFPTLRASFNREERIAIALNMGNAGNMQRLLDGAGWTQAQLQPLLDTITPQEAQFVQAVWGFFESYRPQIAAKERRIYGKEPEWVEPVPITLGGQQLRGGYYPIKYDTAASGQAERHAEAEAAKQQMRGAYTTATTRRSFTKSRAEEVTGRPLLYSFAGLYQGANEVIHDLSWHEWLIDANRLVRSLDLPIRAHYGPETVALFKSAIQDIAAGDVPAQNVFEKGINHLRIGATVAGLGWNFSTALLQPFGLTQSMVRIGPGWVAKGLGRWLKNPIATGDEVQAKSAFMRDRARTMQREINEIQNQVRGSKLDPVRATFFLFIQKAQIVADMPTWLGAYEKAIADGQTEDRAVALADQAVLDAQGGGQMKDLAQIQRGGPLLKLWTNFYSFFNTTYNLAVEKTKQKAVDPKLYPSLAMDYLLLFTIPTVMVSLVKAALSGDLDDEDKLVEKMIADQIGYLLGTMVGLREVTAAAQKVAGVEQFKSNYGGPAGLRMLQEIDKLATQAAQGEADAALLKAANNVAGNLFHYPSGQINRTVEGTAALLDGRTENPTAVLLGPPR